MRELPDDTAKFYLLNTESLDSVLITKNLGLSRTTLYRRIRKQARICPGWDELLEVKKGHSNWGFVMGIDTTGLKIRGADHIYFHTADVTSCDPLAYSICRKEDVATIEPILRQLKNLGYIPKIVVSDLAPELLVSVKKVFPYAVMQGCVFHVALWLDKELPTKKTIKKIGREKAVLWRKAKDIIKHVCISKNESIREQYLEQLKRLNLDETANSVKQRFLSNLKYYHVMDELEGYDTNVLYNGVCERHCGLIKELAGKFRGFKSSIDATNDIIKLFWFLKRRNSLSFPEKEEDVSAYYLPLPSFYDRANLAELSKTSGISREALNESAHKMGHIVVGDFAFTEGQLNDIKNCVWKMKEASLDAVMREIGYDQTTTMELLEKLGFSFLFKSLDPSGIIISPVRHE
jgi:hypothetical protein